MTICMKNIFMKLYTRGGKMTLVLMVSEKQLVGYMHLQIILDCFIARAFIHLSQVCCLFLFIRQKWLHVLAGF